MNYSSVLRIPGGEEKRDLKGTILTGLETEDCTTRAHTVEAEEPHIWGDTCMGK